MSATSRVRRHDHDVRASNPGVGHHVERPAHHDAVVGARRWPRASATASAGVPARRPPPCRGRHPPRPPPRPASARGESGAQATTVPNPAVAQRPRASPPDRGPRTCRPTAVDPPAAANSSTSALASAAHARRRCAPRRRPPAGGARRPRAARAPEPAERAPRPRPRRAGPRRTPRPRPARTRRCHPDGRRGAAAAPRGTPRPGVRTSISRPPTASRLPTQAKSSPRTHTWRHRRRQPPAG